MKRSWTSVLLPAVLLAGCLGLGWVIYHQLMASPAPRPPPAVQTAALLPDLPEAPTFEMPPAEDFAMVTERPLFSPSRRAPSLEAPVVMQTETPLELKLTGIVMSRREPVAIFQPVVEEAPKRSRASRRNRRQRQRAPVVASKNTSIRLLEGDDYQGWTLEEIETSTVLFSRGDEFNRLAIVYDVPAPAQPEQTAKQDSERQAEDQDADQGNANARRNRPPNKEPEDANQ